MYYGLGVILAFVMFFWINKWLVKHFDGLVVPPMPAMVLSLFSWAIIVLVGTFIMIGWISVYIAEYAESQHGVDLYEKMDDKIRIFDKWFKGEK